MTHYFSVMRMAWWHQVIDLKLCPYMRKSDHVTLIFTFHCQMEVTTVSTDCYICDMEDYKECYLFICLFVCFLVCLFVCLLVFCLSICFLYEIIKILNNNK